MTVRKKRETQQQTAVHDAWTHQAQSAAAQTAAEMGSMLGGSRAAWLEYQVPAPETKEGQERLRVYYEALGRFVQMFAEVEKVAAETLWRYVGTKAEIAKIVFSGVQMDHASTFIKQVAAIINTPLEIQADLKNVLDQLGVINGVRNRILHYGATGIAEGEQPSQILGKPKRNLRVFL